MTKRIKEVLRRLFWGTLAFCVLCVMMLNASVRFLGGAPHLLSFRFLKPKARAVGAFALHMPFHIFDKCGEPMKPIVRAAARRHGLPESFVLAVARTESAYRSHVVSHAGAMGVMQLMPATADFLDVSDPFDPEQNIDGGTRYLKQLWKRYNGDARRVAAAYNAGPRRVPKKGRLRLPNETRAYVKAVLRRSKTRG